MRTWLGVSLAGANTGAALAEMERLAALADVIELRLDLMAEFDLAQLLAARPCPVEVTHRPRREGGRFGEENGTEALRLDVLRQAAALPGVAVTSSIDVLPVVREFERSLATILNASGMPAVSVRSSWIGVIAPRMRCALMCCARRRPWARR